MRLVLALALAACSSSSTDKPAVTQRVADDPSPPTLDVPPPVEKVVDIGHGNGIRCVVRESGGVDCWGRWGFGKIFRTPRRMPGVTDAVAISDDATVILRRTGQLALHASDRIELVTSKDLKDVAALTDSPCFILRDHRVTCTSSSWNYYDDLRIIPGLDDAVEVTGVGLTCAVRASGEVVCGVIANSANQQQPLKPLPGLGPVHHLALTGSTGCATLKTGELRCFAIHSDEETKVLSLADTTGDQEKLTGFDPAILAGATQLSIKPKVGYKPQSPPFTLMALVNGRIVEWGPEGTRTLPIDDAKLIAGECVLRATGAVACWGSNMSGELGRTTTIGRSRLPPKPVVGLSDVAKLRLASQVSWAVTRTGKLFAWGSIGGGLATEMRLPAGAKPVTDLAITRLGNACALAGDAVFCRTFETPVFALLATGFKSLAGNYEGVIGLQNDGKVVAWKLDKENGYVPEEGARLDREDRQLPPAPPGTIELIDMAWPCAVNAEKQVFCGKDWSRVPADPLDRLSGHFDGCGIDQASTIRCWDYSFETGKSSPSESPKLTGVTDIGIGDTDFCAVVANGAVVCGLGKLDTQRTVIPSGAIDVEVGGNTSGGETRRDHACAIMADHTVMCWGMNTIGELGDGSITQTNQPIGVRL